MNKKSLACTRNCKKYAKKVTSRNHSSGYLPSSNDSDLGQIHSRRFAQHTNAATEVSQMAQALKRNRDNLAFITTSMQSIFHLKRSPILDYEYGCHTPCKIPAQRCRHFCRTHTVFCHTSIVYWHSCIWNYDDWMRC